MYYWAACANTQSRFQWQVALPSHVISLYRLKAFLVCWVTEKSFSARGVAFLPKPPFQVRRCGKIALLPIFFFTRFLNANRLVHIANGTFIDSKLFSSMAIQKKCEYLCFFFIR